MLETIGSLVREGIATGELREVPEYDATWALIAALNTVMEEQLCHAPPRIDRGGLVRVLNLIINGLGKE